MSISLERYRAKNAGKRPRYLREAKPATTTTTALMMVTNRVRINRQVLSISVLLADIPSNTWHSVQRNTANGLAVAMLVLKKAVDCRLQSVTELVMLLSD